MSFIYVFSSLKTKTSSWLEFCDKLQALDERVKESEKQAYTTRYCDTKEHYRLLQVCLNTRAKGQSYTTTMNSSKVA
jgi:hypothetical protein